MFDFVRMFANRDDLNEDQIIPLLVAGCEGVLASHLLTDEMLCDAAKNSRVRRFFIEKLPENKPWILDSFPRTVKVIRQSSDGLDLIVACLDLREMYDACDQYFRIPDVVTKIYDGDSVLIITKLLASGLISAEEVYDRKLGLDKHLAANCGVNSPELRKRLIGEYPLEFAGRWDLKSAEVEYLMGVSTEVLVRLIEMSNVSRDKIRSLAEDDREEVKKALFAHTKLEFDDEYVSARLAEVESRTEDPCSWH